MNLRVARPSPSLLPVFVLGLALGVGSSGCSTDTDDVYTRDEVGAVGDVARGEASFPVAVGQRVPDVDGRAVTLEPGMIGLELSLYDIYVYGDCDPGDRGEFYYDLWLGLRTVARRRESESRGVHRGDSLPVRASRVFFTAPSLVFPVKASVWEDDDTFTFGDDTVGSYSEWIHAGSVDPSATTWFEGNIGDASCGVTVRYGLRRVQ